MDVKTFLIWHRFFGTVALIKSDITKNNSENLDILANVQCSIICILTGMNMHFVYFGKIKTTFSFGAFAIFRLN